MAESAVKLTEKPVLMEKFVDTERASLMEAAATTSLIPMLAAAQHVLVMPKITARLDHLAHQERREKTVPRVAVDLLDLQVCLVMLLQ